MKKPITCDFGMIAVCLCLTVFVWWIDHTPLFAADGSDVQTEAGEAADGSGEEDVVLNFLKDDRLLTVEQHQGAAIDQLSAEAQATDDPVEAERLQKEIQKAKAEAELEVKKTMLDIAIEKDDKEKIAQLEKDLDALNNPQPVQPDAAGAAQAAGGQSTPAAAAAKNPDDQ